MPLKFNQPIYGSLNPSFTEFMAPGVIIIIIFFLAVALTGEAFISEKQDGLLDRSWVSGVLPIEVMSSHILTQFLVLLVQTSITLIFIFLVFGIPCRGPIGWLILIGNVQFWLTSCQFFLSTRWRFDNCIKRWILLFLKIMKNSWNSRTFVYICQLFVYICQLFVYICQLISAICLH